MSRVKNLCAALLALTFLNSAGAWARSPGCSGVKFSPKVLARFPKAPEVCLDVISRGGAQYGVFKAQLDRISGNTLRLHFTLPDNTRSAAVDIETRPDLRVLIDGEPTRVTDLAEGQELTAYVRIDEPYIAVAPANAGESPHFVPLPSDVAAEP